MDMNLLSAVCRATGHKKLIHLYGNEQKEWLRCRYLRINNFAPSLGTISRGWNWPAQNGTMLHFFSNIWLVWMLIEFFLDIDIAQAESVQNPKILIIWSPSHHLVCGDVGRLERGCRGHRRTPRGGLQLLAGEGSSGGGTIRIPAGGGFEWGRILPV